MAYIDYEYYSSLYGEKGISETDFNRLLWDAEREVDKATSGVDGIKKLEIAFPTTEYDVEAVKRCVSELVSFLYKLQEAESKNQLIERADGSVHSKIITSISAGNESISYSSVNDTAVSTALKSLEDKEKVIYSFVSSRLTGIPDANGVNLLYNGIYPY